MNLKEIDNFDRLYIDYVIGDDFNFEIVDTIELIDEDGDHYAYCYQYSNCAGYFYNTSYGAKYWIEDPNGMSVDEIIDQAVWQDLRV